MTADTIQQHMPACWPGVAVLAGQLHGGINISSSSILFTMQLVYAYYSWRSWMLMR
jgi:hypothetical protein